MLIAIDDRTKLKWIIEFEFRENDILHVSTWYIR